MKFTIYTANCTGNEKNTLYPNQRVITCEGDLKKSITSDHVCAKYKNDTRSDANFIVSDVIPMDCDNDHSDDPDEWITPQFLEDNLTDVVFAVTYSRHHMLSKGNKSARPRFHVFFPTAPCNDALSHKAIKQKIHKELPFFDGNALDASRFLFGCPSDVFWHEGSLSIEDWLTLMQSNRNIPQGQRNSILSRFAGKLVKRFGVNEESYQKFLEKAAKCDPPLSDEELQTIWHSACKFGKKQHLRTDILLLMNTANIPLSPMIFPMSERQEPLWIAFLMRWHLPLQQIIYDITEHTGRSQNTQSPLP